MAEQALSQEQDHSAELDSGRQGAQFLTFLLNGEEYGLDILRVEEIRGWSSITRIPNSPHFVKGVINLRGTIVPIIDLRSRFALSGKPFDATTVVVVVHVLKGVERRIMGLVVDAVSDVYDIKNIDMRNTPEFGSKIDVRFIRGLSMVNDKMVIVLDIDKLLDISELTTVET